MMLRCVAMCVLVCVLVTSSVTAKPRPSHKNLKHYSKWHTVDDQKMDDYDDAMNGQQDMMGMMSGGQGMMDSKDHMKWHNKMMMGKANKKTGQKLIQASSDNIGPGRHGKKHRMKHQKWVSWNPEDNKSQMWWDKPNKQDVFSEKEKFHDGAKKHFGKDKRVKLGKKNNKKLSRYFNKKDKEYDSKKKFIVEDKLKDDNSYELDNKSETDFDDKAWLKNRNKERKDHSKKHHKKSKKKHSNKSERLSVTVKKPNSDTKTKATFDKKKNLSKTKYIYDDDDDDYEYDQFKGESPREIGPDTPLLDPAWPLEDDTDKLPESTTAPISEQTLKTEQKWSDECTTNIDCPMSRICVRGMCLCASKNSCTGHHSPVCGSDGILYPSHCDLHLTACLERRHIRIDDDGLCFAKEQAYQKPSFIPVKKPLSDVPTPPAVPKDVIKEGVSANDKEDKNEKKADVKNKETNIYDDYGKKKWDPNDDITNEFNYEYDSKFDHKKEFEGDPEPKESKPDNSKLSSEHVFNHKPMLSPIVVPGTKTNVIENADNIKDIYDDYYDDNDDDDDKDNKITTDEVTDKNELGTHHKVVAKKKPLCSVEQFTKFKEALVVYHCQIFEEPDCEKEMVNNHQYLVTLMFSYYDRDMDSYLEHDELTEIQRLEKYETLQSACELKDLLRLEETETPGIMTVDEFFKAFSVHKAELSDEFRILPVLATVGHGLELTCGIRGGEDIVWTRNGVDVNSFHMKDITAFEDGSLYISQIAVHHMGNFSCHDRRDPNVQQTHLIRVQMYPKACVIPETQLHHSHTDVTLKCHIEGIPPPSVLWEINEIPLQPSDHYTWLDNNRTLLIHDTTYQRDTGAYKCRAQNQAGVAQDIATLFIQNENSTSQIVSSVDVSHEDFIVFHGEGYSIYDPKRCEVRHDVTASFSQFAYPLDNMNTPPTLCEETPCAWGSAVSVGGKYVFVSQPREHRVAVIEVTERWNPVQLIETDKVPMEVHYLKHLDQVWVLCWNSKDDDGGKTIIVIRDASKDVKHHIIHTQPVGNEFDLVQNMFLPPRNDIDHHFQHGYVMHTGQKGLYKLDLDDMAYIKAIDLHDHGCEPVSVAFMPTGGNIVIACRGEGVDIKEHFLISLDYLSDIVVQNISLRGTPYITPDSRHLIIVDEATGEITVYTVNALGALKREFIVHTSVAVSDVAFHPAEDRIGYNVFVNSNTKGKLLFVDLSNGKTDTIKGMDMYGQMTSWRHKGIRHALASGGVFGEYLMTLADEHLVVIHGKAHHVLCEFKDIKNGQIILAIKPLQV